MDHLPGLVELCKTKSAEIIRTMEHQPLVFCYGPGDRLHSVQLIITASGHLREGVRHVLERLQPDGYLLIAEARMKTLHPEDIGLHVPGSIAQDPAYPECLVLQGYERTTGTATVWVAEIKGTLPHRRLDPWQDRAAELVQGMMVTEW